MLILASATMKTPFVIAAICMLSVASAQATVPEPAPWAPRAAAYRLTLFMGNLDPVPWERLRESWEHPVAGAAVPVAALSRVRGNEATALRAALKAQNRQALFEAATETVADGILRHIAAAGESPGAPEAAAEAARAEALFRAFADGIAAGDPDAARGLGRAWLALHSSLGSQGVLGNGARPADEQGFAEASAAITDYLRVNYMPKNFARRDRLTPVPETALRSEANAALPASLPPGAAIAAQNPLPRLVLQFEEAGIEESSLPLVAYGDMLFDSPQLFGSPARELGIACSTCHNRSDVNRDFFIPGLSARPGGMDVDGAFFNPLFNDRVDDHLDIPSLRGIRFTAPYGRDGREASLRRFTRDVIVTEFAGAEPTPFQLDALVAYMRQFDFLPNSMIDRDGRLTDLASNAARRGEKLFYTEFEGLGGRSCASCHTPERNFHDGLTHDIGTAEPPFPGGTPIHFETPTLRNVAFTAPYMHDGSLPTLAGVVDWFNDTKSLGLDEASRADLTAYLEAVGDGEEPYQDFEGRDSSFRLSFDEILTFASTLDTLLPAQDATNIAVLIDTIAPDLTLDAATMVNLGAKPLAYELSDLLSAIGESAALGEWDEAARTWEAFRARTAEYDERMY